MDLVEALSLVVAFIFAITARITKSALSHSSSSFLILLMVLSGVGSTSGQVSVLTQHNDNARSGANLNETRLNTSNVNPAQFRKLYSLRVDGNIFAQPLYVTHVSVHGHTYNVLFVATEHNTVYAFDADVSSVEPLWQANLGTSAAMPNSDFGNGGSANFNLVPEVGITSTPVIDVASRTLYVVAFTKESDGSYHHKLHALDITNGAEKLNGPVEISGSVNGNGNSCTIRFVPKQQLQRPALLLSGGFIYIAFGSHNDTSPYNGWVFAYNSSNLQRAGIFNTTPRCEGTQPYTQSKGGIWQAGQGLVGDAGYVYFLVGDGFFASGQSFGSSFVKLSSPANGSLPVADWFAPKNQADLNGLLDNDLGSAGPLLLPRTNWLLGGGKEGKLYLVDSTNMGKYNPTDNVLQSFQATQPPPGKTGHIHGSPIYWESSTDKLIYVWGENDKLKAYKLNNAPLYFNTSPSYVADLPIINGMPGGILSLSASGSTTGTGIVWATHPLRDNASDANVEGVLYAFDASNLNNPELWSSEMNPIRDSLGLFAKFCPVTIANGKVYVPTFSGYLHVYGLRSDHRAPRQPTPQPTPSASPLTPDTTTGGNWSGGYGSAGYYVVGDSALYPPRAKVNPVVPRAKVWWDLARTPTPAMLRRATRTTGTTDTSIAASWTSDNQESFLIDIDVHPGITYRVSLYFSDWDNKEGRSEKIDILNPAADDMVLSTQTVSSFASGKYLKWNITGHVRIRIKKLTGDPAVVSGLFFDPAGI